MKNLLSDEEEGSEKFFNLKLNWKMNQLRARSKYLSPDQWKIRRVIQAEILKGSDLIIPKGLYDNIKYKMNIVITGEQIDVAARQQSLDTLMIMLAQNPGILEDKRIRKIIYRRMDLAGINPKELFDEEIPGITQIAGEMRAQRGGSVAAPPTAPAAPAMMPTTATL